MKTLLLAESHPPTREHLTAVLSQAGYTVRAVSEPGPALEHFVADNPALVVVSVDLPRLDGAHVGHLIRNNSMGSRVPIVAIDKGHLGRARGVASVLDLKVNAYVADPLKPGELVGRLQSLAAAAVQQNAALKGVRAMLVRPAELGGDLKGFPLPAVLMGLYRQRREGVLVVAHRDLTRRIFFARGGAVSYDSSARSDALPGYLLQRQVVTAAQAERVVEALGARLRIGAALAEAGVEAAGEELLHLLRDYTAERVAQVIGMREGRYSFYPGDEFQAEVATVDTPALAPVLEGARRSLPLKVVAAPLRAHLDGFPVRSPEFGKHLPSMGLNTEDLKIAMQINGRIALRDLLAHGRGDLRRGYSLLWFLKLVGGVDFSPVPVASGPGEVVGGGGRHRPAQAQAHAGRDPDVLARGRGEDHHRQLPALPGAGRVGGQRGGGARLPRARHALPSGHPRRVRHLGHEGPARLGAGEAVGGVPGAVGGGEAQGLPAVPHVAGGPCRAGRAWRRSCACAAARRRSRRSSTARRSCTSRRR